MQRLPATLAAPEEGVRAALQALIDEPVPLPDAGTPLVDDKTPKRRAHVPKARPRPAELSDAALSAITRTSSTRASRCYVEHLLSIDGTAEGEVTLAVTVLPAGTVSAAAIKKTPFTNDAFHSCLMEATKIWKFPIFDGDDDVVLQKLYFRPG